MSIKPSIYMVMVSNIRVFFIFIVTKIECWPVFKQDPIYGFNYIYIYSNIYSHSIKICHLYNNEPFQLSIKQEHSKKEQ